MSKRFQQLHVGVLAVLLFVQACSGPSTPVDALTATAPAPAPARVLATRTATASPVPPTGTAIAAGSETPASTFPGVTITASGGDLAIRTGPDEVFDAIATLHDGESAMALARSLLVGWLQIPIPSMPGETGWVSIRTKYSIVEGEVLDLPKIMSVEWPVGSYLRNCTSHRLIVEPGGKVLPPVEQAPENRVWFHPGLYHVYDLDLPGRPEVTGIQLGPHTEVGIVEDGANQRGVCP